MNIQVKTIRAGWANSTDYLANQNVKNNRFVDALEQYKKENDLQEYEHYFGGGFYSKEHTNKRRVIVKGWYWRGNWADPTKETYCYLIEK